MTVMEEIAMLKLRTRATKQLLRDWDATDKMQITPELAMVRAWIMDELEVRYPEEMNRYYESDCSDFRKFIPE